MARAAQSPTDGKSAPPRDDVLANVGTAFGRRRVTFFVVGGDGALCPKLTSPLPAGSGSLHPGTCQVTHSFVPEQSHSLTPCVPRRILSVPAWHWVGKVDVPLVTSAFHSLVFIIFLFAETRLLSSFWPLMDFPCTYPTKEMWNSSSD